MKKIYAFLLTLCLLLCLTACAGGSAEETADTAGSSSATAAEQPEDTEEAAEQSEDTEAAAAEQPEEEEAEGSSEGTKTLVVYFSATGNTKGVAEKIASITGADIYEIKAAQEYTEADIDYNDSDSRTTHEQNDPSVRPEIGSDPVSLDGYTTIYIGYPIWWGEEPRIMDTFVESYDFDGITMIPFCTSGSSDIGSSGQNLADNAGSGNWLEGARFSGGASEDEIRTWIEGLQ